MHSLTSILNEVFDRPYPVQKRGDGVYTFRTAAGLEYKIMFHGAEAGTESYTMDFRLLNNPKVDTLLNLYKAWFGASGTGDAQRVFATVVRTVTEWLKSKRPKQLWFSADADEPSRIKLYKMMAGRIPLPSGYEVKMDKREGETFFYIKRRERLNEVFDRPYPFRPVFATKKGDGQWWFRTRDGRKYLISILDPFDNDMWEVQFELDDDYVGDRTGITGTGDAARVFATVVAVLRAWLDYHKPLQIHFTVDRTEASRLRLYGTMLKRMPLPTGYKAFTDSRGYYALIRKDLYKR